jgi:hypothetical protein
MVLIAIIGELGVGKTLGLTYLVWNNYYYKKRQIAANYNLYGIPFTPIKTLEDLKKMIPSETATIEQLLVQKEVFFAGDELWRWIDSRCAIMGFSKQKTQKIENKVITDILAASRKAFVTIGYTSQTYDQVDKRIKNITDFVFYPVILGDNTLCKITVFKGSKPTVSAMLPDIRFFCEPMYAMYNTYEIVQPLEQGELSDEVLIPVNQNPAWIKYCKDRKMTDEAITRESEQMTKLIIRKGVET